MANVEDDFDDEPDVTRAMSNQTAKSQTKKMTTTPIMSRESHLI